MHTFLSRACTPASNAQLGSEGVNSIAKKTQVNLAEIAAQSDLNETLSTKELIGKKFTINNVKRVSGMYGETFVGDLTLDGKNVEAWLSGAKVFRQIEALLEGDDLPRDNLTMIRDAESYGEPFVLTDA
tara:strand:- start:987 stop:1373 length:387 start_codon:yes stop_codon:yes gene_type:complete